MNILIIEDEALIAKSLKKMLELRGATVSIAPNGVSATYELANHQFDRIICDLMLQDTTGFDIIEDSKKFISSGDIAKKFVIMTAYSSSDILVRAETYGCPILKKPFKNISEAIGIILGTA